MTSDKATPKTSRDLPAEPVREDTARDTRDAAVATADKTGVDDRDLVHGEGGTIDLPTRPGDLARDD